MSIETNQNIKIEDLFNNLTIITSKVAQIVLELSNSLLLPSINALKTMLNSISISEGLPQDVITQNNIKNLLESQKNVLNSFIEFSNYLSEITTKLINSIITSFKVEDIVNYINKILNYAKQIITKIFAILKEILNINFLDTILKFIENFMNSLSSNIEKLSKSNMTLADMLKMFVDQDFAVFMSIFAPIAKALGQAIRSVGVETKVSSQENLSK